MRYFHSAEEITLKEVIIGIGILLLVISLAIIIKIPIDDRLNREIRIYEQAIKIEDSNQFLYAIKTNVGDIVGYGELESIQAQKIPELNGEYALIEKIEEKYTMHTRVSCHKSGNSNVCTTHIYYSWDFYGRQIFETDEYLFMGYTFNKSILNTSAQNSLNLNSETVSSDFIDKVHGYYIYQENKFLNSVGDRRYSYKTLNTKNNATIVLRAYNNTIYNPVNIKSELNVYINSDIEQVLTQKKESNNLITVAYYFLFISVFMALYFYIAYKKLNIY